MACTNLKIITTTLYNYRLNVIHFLLSQKHVWVVCRYGDQWLLTHHLRRGLEFPGGKVELGETPEEAAVREFMKKPAA